MYRKLKNIISHPSFLGMYFMDHLHSIFGWFISFLILTTLLLALVDMGKVSIGKNQATRISDSLIYSGKINDASYDNDKLLGSHQKIEMEYALISFNDNAYMNNTLYDGIVLVFGMENANMYYGNIHLGKVDYKDLSISNFSLEEIRNGNILMRQSFELLVFKSIEAGEANYRAVCFFSDFVNILIYYLISLVGCYFLAFLVNPKIERRFRIKLVVYDTLIYFVFLWFDMAFSAFWLLYVGMAFTLIYTIFTFTHIRAVRVGRR